MMDERSIFLDTNSLLHYPPISNVSWRQICGSDCVHLLLCLQVIHELDEKKDDARLGGRAKRIIKEIKNIRLGDGHVADGVSLDIFNYEVKSADFPTSLSYDSKDDRIVHAVRKYAESNPGANIAVYSEDMGMGLRCAAHGLTVIEPDPTTRLENPQSEHDAKYKRTMIELNDLKNRSPRLSIVVSHPDSKQPDTGLFQVAMQPSVSSRDLAAEFTEYQSRNNLFPMERLEMAASPLLFALVKPDNVIGKFNRDLERHLADYKKWLEERALLESMKTHEIAVSIWLVNNGLAPGDDIDVSLVIGEPVVIVYEEGSDEAQSFNLSKPPTAPERPVKLTSFLNDSHFILRSHFQEPLGVEDIWSNRPKIEQSEDVHVVRFSSARLKHNENQRLCNLRLVLAPEAVRPFQITYRMTAANVTEVIEGDIPIVVRIADACRT